MSPPDQQEQQPDFTRRLVGVMFTDIVGYSSKASVDEIETLRLVKEHNELLSEIIAQHRGEIVKTIGDAVMGRFPSIVRAVECALEIQSRLKDFNTGKDKSEKLLLRIGVHAGDVLETADSDLFGHDVNIAARLEPLAEPGSVIITDIVYSLIQSQSNLAFHQLGDFKLKNIPTPMSLYTVSRAHEIEHDEKMVGPYRIIEQLGAGGMGEVWLAEDSRLDRKVAIKFLPYHAAHNEAERARFIQEAKAAARLTHPNIAQVHEINEEDGRFYIVMEYVESGSLRDHLDTAKGKCLPLSGVIKWMLQVAEGLAEAHLQGVVHRDIKPDNLMLTRSGHIKITDFGLAHLDSSTKLTASGAILGTVNYMSPEQVVGNEVNGRTDLFSLGATFYELLTGYQPFEGVDASAIYYSILHKEPEPVYRFRRDTDQTLDFIISKLLQKDPDHRYQSASEVAADLRRLLSNISSGEDDDVCFDPVRRKKKRQNQSMSPATIGILSGLAFVLLAGSIWFFTIGPGATPKQPVIVEQPDSTSISKPTTESQRALDTILASFAEQERLGRQLDSLQTVLDDQQASSQSQPNQTSVSPALLALQSRVDSLMSLSYEKINPSTTERVNTIGDIHIKSPRPAAIIRENEVYVDFTVEPFYNVERVHVSVDGEVQIDEPVGLDEVFSRTSRIDLRNSGRHIICISILDAVGNRSEKSLNVLYNPEGEAITIGVLDLTSFGLDSTEVRIVSERLRYYLGEQDVFEVIADKTMTTLMEEIGFQTSGACDTDECVVQIGQILGATKMLAGSIDKVGTIYALQIRMIDIETGRIEGVAFKDIDGGMEQVLTLAVEDISSELADSALRSLAPFESTQQSTEIDPVLMAMLDLEGINIPDDEARAIASRLRFYLSQEDCFQVLERDLVRELLDEMGFQTTGALNDYYSATQIGQIVGARKVAYGTVSNIDGFYTLQVQIIDVMTGRIENQTLIDARGIEAVMREATLSVAEKLASFYTPDFM
ncbi:protein kinase [Gemmatimonadota bacterium]